jgi:NAD(P)-dependent dehydrogenase (short-subunit alcohol dehydrogenase family)
MTTPKTILITGASDGIGLATAHKLAAQGHTLLLHGRSPGKLAAAATALSALPGVGHISTYVADLSSLGAVDQLGQAITTEHRHLDVLINNAGILKTPNTRTADGLDVRFAVNTIAPYRLTQRLLPLLSTSSRVINLSSAAQAPVNVDALAGRVTLDDMPAYAQSKLAITMWSRHMAQQLKATGPLVVAVNPGSLLATRMVTEGFGIAGSDVSIGADILCRAALSDEFASANGLYFDNDTKRFADPHTDALDAHKSSAVVQAIEAVLQQLAA